MKVGELLAPPPADLGGWLADAAAFDAAGADALWIDVASDPALDPLAMTAALAVLTYRSLLVTALPAAADGRTLATIERLSRGRLARDFVTEPEGEVVVRETGDEPERWVRTAWSGGRAAWRDAVAEAAGRGAAGLLVPAGSSLLDLLRNPGDSGDRRDLQLAQG
jgi:hypothetical protein